MSDLWPIPHSWAWTRTENIATIVGGGTPDTQKSEYFGGDIAWITPTDLSGYTAKHIAKGARDLTEAGYRHSGAQLMPAGAVVFSSRAPIGYVAIASNPLCTNQGFKSFVPERRVSSDFLYYYLHRAKPLAVKLASGTTFLEISGKKAATLPVPIPPFAEQQRIAEKLDELLSDLDAGLAALERVRTKLKCYRVAVLKAAMEGALTAEWRVQHPATETAGALLTRILTERRHRWEEAQLVKFKAAGKSPSKDWRAKYPGPLASNTTDLPMLPDGWCWTVLDALFIDGPQNGAYFPSERYGSGTPILRIDDYQNGWLRAVPELRRVSASGDDAKLYSLREGDLVINRVNSMTHIGKCVVISKAMAGCIFESNMMRARFATLVVPRFIEAYLHSSTGRQRLIKEAKWAVNQASINQQDVKRTPVPLPPLAEQAAIVDVVEDQLSVIEHLEDDVEAKLKSAQGLRQAILRHAFAGNLVPQDPNDEPASELLKRIAADREERTQQVMAAKHAKQNPRTPRRRVAKT